MDGFSLGRLLVVVGVLLAVLGVALIAGQRIGLGRLPGDIAFRRGNLGVYVPLATCIVLSIVLTVVANLFLRR